MTLNCNVIDSKLNDFMCVHDRMKVYYNHDIILDLFMILEHDMVSTLALQYTIVKLQVVGNEVVVKQSPPCYHSQSFMNFIPLMELGGREYTALRVYYY